MVGDRRDRPRRDHAVVAGLSPNVADGPVGADGMSTSIWATEVLDTLARTGVPSRAEVTDGAASVAAECVMLNKGPHVEEALCALVNILRRMERHHYKKRSIFRKLRVSALEETPGQVSIGS
jgi:hypothetical protein